MPDNDSNCRMISDAAAYAAALNDLKITMTVIGVDAATEGLWGIACLRATGVSERQAIRVRSRPVIAGQPWVDQLAQDVVAFVTNMDNELKDTILRSELANTAGLGDRVEDAYVRGYA